MNWGNTHTRSTREAEDWRWQFKNRLFRFQDLPENLQQRMMRSFTLFGEQLKDKRTRATYSRLSPGFAFAALPGTALSGTGLAAALQAGIQAGSLPLPFPLATTPYYLGLGDPADEADPILPQILPAAGELFYKNYELADPLGEDRFMPVKKLIHRYPDRVLILTTNVCASYCRFCFRRYYTGRSAEELDPRELAEIAAYITRHPEIREVILSGGDPLTLENEHLYSILHTLKKARKDLYFRIGTRVPVVLPQRLEPALVELLAQFKPLWIVTQFNHTREIQPASQTGIDRLLTAGIPVLNQTVLLRGINNDLVTLSALFHALVRERIKPYYLFQGDLAQGTAHFRTPLAQGLALMESIKFHISGLARPVYAVDLPGGGGKIPLTPCLIKRKKAWYELKSPTTGRIYRYPAEH